MEKGNAILINGASSSGKTMLALALQERLPEPYLHIGIDKLIEMMPAHLNNWEGGRVEQGFWWKSAYDDAGHLLQHIQLGPYAKKVSQLLKNIVLTILNSGMNVIIDEVCVGEYSTLADWKSALAPYQVLYVGIHSSIEKLEEREKQRGDRILGSARAQWMAVHSDAEYDLELTTDNRSLEDCVNQVTEKLAGRAQLQ